MRDSARNPLSRRRLLACAASSATAACWPAHGRREATFDPPALPLPAALRQLLAGAGVPAANIGLHIQAVQRQAAPLAAHNGEQLFQLASTAKLVTTLAALDLLGVGYRWRTPAFLLGPLEGGRLDGDLLILGGGDALLSSEDMLAWFRQMRAMGLTEVRGNIVLDRLGFQLSEGDLASTPTPSPDRPHHVRPDALVLDEGRLRLRVQARPDRPAQLQLLPAVAGLHLQSELGTGPGCQVHTELLPGPDVPAGTSRLAVRGQWGGECGQKDLQLAPWSHAEYTRRAVAALWREAGGRLRGKVVAAPARPGSPSAWPHDAEGRLMQAWSVRRSDTLPDVLRDLNKTSDNLVARNLMLSMAPGFPLRIATLPRARERVQRWLSQQGLAQGDIAVDSGSGLSREERGKPRALVHLLRRAWYTPHQKPLLASLPVAGVDGTLAHRMTHGQATGRAFLKTGTLLDTRALAGYVVSRGGTTYAVAALVNHSEAQRATPALDRIVEWVAAQG